MTPCSTHADDHAVGAGFVVEHDRVGLRAGMNVMGAMIPASEHLDVKSMNCISNAMLVAFCHWDGGQLATDEVLDFVTDSPASLGNQVGCGSQKGDVGTGGRCGERVDVVRIKPGDEPWMDLHGNLNEAVLDTDGATFTGKFGLKYRGIGYSSARSELNTTPDASGVKRIERPEARGGFAGGRCMRFK